MLRAAAVALVCCAALYAQSRGIRISVADLAILNQAQPRRDFPCAVRAIKPALGFDLRLHAGYQADIRPEPPVQKEGNLQVVMRVTPAGAGALPVNFTERARVPNLEELQKRRLTVTGAFAVGEGSYRVDWLLRDQAGGVCSAHWNVEAKLPRRARGISLTPPGRVQSNSLNPFRREPPGPRAEPLLHVKVLVNFASRSVSTAILEPRNLDPVLAILRAMVRDARVSRFSVVGFLLADQRIFYRQGEADAIDFPGLGKALRSLELGTVEYERLVQERGREWFLADLLKAEIGGADRPDALVIVSPRVGMREDVPARELKELGPLGYPVFYLKCGLFRLPDPSDAIGRLIGIFRGREYRILAPAEIGYAVRDTVDRIARSKAARQTPAGL